MLEPRDLTAYQVKEDGSHGVIAIKNDLKALQEAVGGYIDIVRRRIGPEERVYTIVCDEEGLMKKRAFTAVVAGHKIALVGTLLVLRADGCGQLAPLSLDDIDYIQTSMYHILAPEGGHKAVLGVL
ncbi:MAG: DUF3846 domain-containing protein [Candidatus Methanomethylophilaceae archaeon]